MKKLKITKNLIIILLFSTIIFFGINCGSTSQDPVSVNINMKAPKFVSSSSTSFTATAKAYSRGGTLLSSASASLSGTMTGSISLDVEPQSDVSFVVTISYDGTTLIRGSKIVNVTGATSIDLALGVHAFPDFSTGSTVSGAVSGIISANDTYSLALVTTSATSDSITTYSDILLIFDETKGVFTGKHTIGTTSYDMSQYAPAKNAPSFGPGETRTGVYPIDYTVDGSGNIYVVAANSDSQEIMEIHVIPAGGSLAKGYDTTLSTYVSSYDLQFIVTECGSVKLLTKNSTTWTIYTVSLSSSTVSLSKLSEFTNSAYSSFYQDGNRLYFPYTPGSIYYEYTDDWGQTFSDPFYLINETTPTGFDVSRNFIASDSQTMIANSHAMSSYYTSSYPLSAYRMKADTTVSDVVTILNSDTFNADYMKMHGFVGGGGYAYYAMMSDTNMLYYVYSSDWGDNWSAPQKLYNGLIYGSCCGLVSSSDVKIDANNKNMKVAYKVGTACTDVVMFFAERFGAMPTNYAPIITAISDATVTEGNAYSGSISATDLDGNTLYYSLVSGPSGFSVTETTGAMSWTSSSAAEQTVVIAVTDTIDTAYDTFVITVTAASAGGGGDAPTIVNPYPGDSTTQGAYEACVLEITGVSEGDVDTESVCFYYSCYTSTWSSWTCVAMSTGWYTSPSDMYSSYLNLQDYTSGITSMRYYFKITMTSGSIYYFGSGGVTTSDPSSSAYKTITVNPS